MNDINLVDMTDGARYSKNLNTLAQQLKVKEILKLSSETDYSGFVDVDALLEDGRVWSYRYTYGSCSGCDEWESLELNDEAIVEAMKQGSTFFNNLDQYKKFDEMRQGH